MTDGAVAHGGEVAAVRRRQLALSEGAFPGPLASVALAAAIELEGGEILRAAEAATPLLLSYYFKNEKQIFALLTDDTNFFVYGVRYLTRARFANCNALCIRAFLWRAARFSDVRSCMSVAGQSEIRVKSPYWLYKSEERADSCSYMLYHNACWYFRWSGSLFSRTCASAPTQSTSASGPPPPPGATGARRG